jgi:hypothetical protein
MWYETENEEIKKHEPIFAKTSGGEIYLLLPQIRKGNFDVYGYNWLNIKTGEYNSCCVFEDIESALEAYKGYDIFNSNILYK